MHAAEPGILMTEPPCLPTRGKTDPDMQNFISRESSYLVLQEILRDSREGLRRQQGLEGLEHRVGEALERGPRRFVTVVGAGRRPVEGREGSQQQQELL